MSQNKETRIYLCQFCIRGRRTAITIHVQARLQQSQRPSFGVVGKLIPISSI
ncbi:hypothetical protein PIB30_085572, partial [Stylosanthes scabra]|nr:hypothetical protein [Stylosanthes scabra]